MSRRGEDGIITASLKLSSSSYHTGYRGSFFCILFFIFYIFPHAIMALLWLNIDFHAMFPSGTFCYFPKDSPFFCSNWSIQGFLPLHFFHLISKLTYLSIFAVGRARIVYHTQISEQWGREIERRERDVVTSITKDILQWRNEDQNQSLWYAYFIMFSLLTFFLPSLLAFSSLTYTGLSTEKRDSQGVFGKVTRHTGALILSD